MAKTFTISDEVREILQHCSITEERVYLPQTQLPRPLYVAVDKALKAAGGKWNKSLQCHVFTRDPRPFLLPALETGAVTHLQQSLQAFYTPPVVAEQVVALANLTPSSRVLEPSAGMGALALEAVKRVPKEQIWCVDTDEVAVKHLEHLGFYTLGVDFLSCTLVGHIEGLSGIQLPTFDAILMNPPFANGQDMAHIQHAHTFLRAGGRLVSVVPAMTGHKTRKNTEKAFAEFLLAYLVDRIELPEASFASSGTKVATSILVLRG